MDTEKLEEMFGREFVSTVNVIQTIDGIPNSVKSFNDNEIGNRVAEIVFHDAIKEEFPDELDEEIEAAIEDGYYQKRSFSIFLTHSD